MDKQEFIKLFDAASDELDIDWITEVMSKCLDRCHKLYPQYERGLMNIISSTEENAEYIEALSKRKRGRTTDNYELLEEIGDNILSMLCIGEVFGFSYKEIIKAMNAKAEREAGRILEQMGIDLRKQTKGERTMVKFEEREANQAPEPTTEQVQRLDKLDKAAFEYLKVVTNKSELEWDHDSIAELNNLVADFMSRKDMKIYYPALKTESDGTKHWVDYHETNELFRGMIVDGAYYNEEQFGRLPDDNSVPESLNKYPLLVEDFSEGYITVWGHSEEEAMDIASNLTEAEIKKYRGCHHVGIKVKAEVKDDELNNRIVTLVLKDQDGIDENYHMIKVITALPEDEIIPAIKAASKDFLNTPEGRKVWKQNGKHFNYGDFDLYVSNAFCMPHGFFRPKSNDTDIIQTDDFNAQLAEPETGE